MGKVALLTTTLLLAVGITGIGVPRTAIADNHGVTVTVKGESWDGHRAPRSVPENPEPD